MLYNLFDDIHSAYNELQLEKVASREAEFISYCKYISNMNRIPILVCTNKTLYVAHSMPMDKAMKYDVQQARMQKLDVNIEVDEKQIAMGNIDRDKLRELLDRMRKKAVECGVMNVFIVAPGASVTHTMGMGAAQKLRRIHATWEKMNNENPNEDWGKDKEN